MPAAAAAAVIELSLAQNAVCATWRYLAAALVLLMVTTKQFCMQGRNMAAVLLQWHAPRLALHCFWFDGGLGAAAGDVARNRCTA